MIIEILLFISLLAHKQAGELFGRLQAARRESGMDAMNQRNEPKKGHPASTSPGGFPRLCMKNGRDVAASSHFSCLPRQLLHAFLYLLHPCSRRQLAEREGILPLNDRRVMIF